MKGKHVIRSSALAATVLCGVLTPYGQATNDNFADRILLAGSTVDFVATTQGATFETNDPTASLSGAKPKTGSVWWSWTAPISGYATLSFTDVTNILPTTLVFSGDIFGNLAYSNLVLYVDTIGRNETFGGFRTTVGQPYSIALVGDYTTNILYSLRLEVTDAVIVEHPQSQTVPAGGACFFGVIAPGVGTNGNVQWQHNGLNIPGANAATLIITNASARDAGEYRAVVNILDPSATTTSLPATLTVEGPDIQPQIQLSYIAGTTNRFNVRVLGETNMSYEVRYSTNFVFDSTLIAPGLVRPVPYVTVPYLASAVDAEFQPGAVGLSFLKAVRAGNMQQTCRANLRRIQFAKKIWQVNHSMLEGTPTDINAVNAEGLDGHTITCPVGGTISYDGIGTSPICTVAGHTI